MVIPLLANQDLTLMLYRTGFLILAKTSVEKRRTSARLKASCTWEWISFQSVLL